MKSFGNGWTDLFLSNNEMDSNNNCKTSTISFNKSKIQNFKLNTQFNDFRSNNTR